MKKVILVINNFAWFGKREFKTWLPAVPIITRLIKNICDFSVLDANVNQWDFNQTQNAIQKTEADIVLISALSVDYQKQYHKLADIAKRALPGCLVFMGGVYPSVLPDQVMADVNVDIAMQGHAEERLPRILQEIFKNDIEHLYVEHGICFRANGIIVKNPLKSQLYQVKKMIQPDYSCIDIEKYFEFQSEYSAKNYSSECAEKRTVNIISSYGCPYNCFFCANHSLSGSHVVYRPMEDILEEIDFFVLKYSVQQISFMDDNIVADKKRAKKLFEEIKKRNYSLEIQIGNLAAWDLDEETLVLLKEAGCTRIGISVESGSQRVLKEVMHKPLRLEIIPPLVKKFRELEIMLVADFIIGLPGETWDDIRMTFYYADNLDADLCNFNIAVPYPGTGLYDYMVKNNMLPEDFSFTSNFYISGLARTSEFTPAELKILQAFEWERINAGTKEKRARAQKVLRLSEQGLTEYCSQMRESAIRFVKNYC